MARSAYDFFHAMAEAQAHPPDGGTPRDRLRWFLRSTAEVFAAHSDFLRLYLILLMSAEAADAEVGAMIERVRRDGRRHMNRMIASAYADAGPEIAQAVADELDYFGIAGFDGAFIAWQAEPSRGLTGPLVRLADAMAALGDAIVADHRG